MPTDQFSVKTSPEAIARFEAEFQAAKAQNPELTKGNFFNEYTARQSAQDKNTDPVNLSQYVSVEKYNEDIEEVNKQLDQISILLFGEAYKNINEIIAEIKATQQRAMMALQTQEPQIQPLAENEILFTIPEPHLSILKETTARLSDYYGKTITIADIMLDMAIRYEVQRNAEWFYPFLIRTKEFKAITGYTYDELNAFIKNRK